MNVKVKCILVSAALFAGCDSSDLRELHRIQDHSATEEDSSGISGRQDIILHDTVVRFVAVEAEDGYDWRRDTLAGTFRGRLVLYRNGKEELSLKIGPGTEISPDYGTHFILDGKLYTYYCTEYLSVVKCNGAEIMRSQEREVLKGLLPTEEGVLTLSETFGGGEFIVRRDGDEVMRFEADNVFGSMDDDSYPLSGALYRDGGNGSWYFCYSSTVAGGPAYYIVENLQTRALSPPVDLNSHDVKDIKMEGGNINYFSIYEGKYASIHYNGETGLLSGASGLESYYDGRVLAGRQGSTAVGNFTKPTNYRGRSLFSFPKSSTGKSYFWDGFIIPGNGDAHLLLYYGSGDFLLAYCKSGGGPRVGNGCHCFSRRSTSSIGDCVFLALTPKQAGEMPYIWKSGGDTVRVNVRNGYLTSLTAVDSVTTIPGDSRQD